MAFRGDTFPSAALYSLLDFARVLLVFSFWMLALCFVNRDTPDTDAVLKLLRLHTGRIARWPAGLQCLLPLVVVAVLWVGCQPLLAGVGVISRIGGTEILVKQALLVGLALFLTLKYLLPVFLLLHFVSSYVYLGNNAFWEFVANTARGVLKPLKSLPLQVGRLDLAPLVATILILLLLEALPRWVVQELRLHQRMVWPH